LNKPIHILVAASEATPLARTSCMGDVVSALPESLLSLGIDITLIIPRHKIIPDTFKQEKILENIPVSIGDRHVSTDIYLTHINDLPVYLVDQPAYFDRPDLYQSENGDYPDNAERFIFFSRAVVDLLPFYEKKPSIIHCHDWQTGLTPLYLRLFQENHPEFRDVKSLFTVHNLAYQGLFWRFDMHLTGLPWKYFTPESIEFYGDLNLLKAGLVHSDAINTVSPTYCREIQTPEFGCGLDGVLRTRKDNLYGILNGADYTQWSPDIKTGIAASYSISNLSGKKTCKAELLKQAQLNVSVDKPLISMISPLFTRKGVDLLELSIKQLVDRNCQIILQGRGDRNYMKIFQSLAEQFSDNFAFFNDLSQSFSKKVIAGSDLLLTPSRFEPCGLNQIYALRFGTIPIAHKTGGLDDTVVDIDSLNDKHPTGFKFSEYSGESLMMTVNRALELYNDPEAWQSLMISGMKQDYSWKRSAEKYSELYSKILETE